MRKTRLHKSNKQFTADEAEYMGRNVLRIVLANRRQQGLQLPDIRDLVKASQEWQKLFTRILKDEEPGRDADRAFNRVREKYLMI